EYTPPATYPEKVEETLGIPIEVEPLDETPLHDLGLNTCNHDIPLSSKKIPSIDEPEPQPQPLPNCLSLDVSLGEEKGTEPPIKPYSLDSFRMKEVDSLTINTPPSPHVESSHPKDTYCYYRLCIDDPKKHYGFKPGLLGKSASLGVDILNWEMFDDDWGLESKEVSPLGKELSLFDRPNKVERGNECDFPFPQGGGSGFQPGIKENTSSMEAAGNQPKTKFRQKGRLQEPAKRKGPVKSSKKGEVSRKDKALAILMVQPWQRVSRQRVTQSFSPDPKISFPPLGDEDGMKGPMIIEAEIGGHFIHRIYVDGGSDSEILYEHCFNRLRPEVKSQMVPATTPLIGFSGEIIWPIGQISLAVKIGDMEYSTSTRMNFVVVRLPSPYNGIIGRPGVRKI
ncbi:hypothetical protein Tco_0885138, partial [Tanacetum coccineum]